MPAVGTINLLVLVDAPLDDAALAGAAQTAIEAKAQALAAAAIPAANADCHATGTATDAFCIAALPGGGEPFAGPATAIGADVAHAVHRAVLAGARADRADFGRSYEEGRTMSARLTVVGIGADGWDGLGGAGRAAVADASAAGRLGAAARARAGRMRPRTARGACRGRRRWSRCSTSWPPAATATPSCSPPATRCCTGSAEASRALADRGAARARARRAARTSRSCSVIPHPSAFALACARMLWSEHETELVSTVARAPEQVTRALQAGRRLIVYATGDRRAPRGSRRR